MAKGPDLARSTVIGKGTVLEGSFCLDHDLWVDGRVHGQLVCAGGSLYVGPEGEICAPRIEVGKATIAGRVEGLLRVRGEVRLEAGAVFRGWLVTPHVFVAEGATMEADPQYAPSDV